ncbi:Putative pre-16S rRNA nuclease [Phycisphaerales bacterium]|nr:Putative pre-16S rRNA nuclease [Phycisphaerales bacterium]
MRYLAIDLGDKRTGLAAGDSTTRIVTPLEVIEVPLAARAGEALLDAIARMIVEQWGEPPASGSELVVGLPLNMDETEGPRAKLVRTFGARIEARTGLKVHYQDERLSSAAADWLMARTGMTRGQKKAKRDALAAAAILADYLKSVAS